MLPASREKRAVAYDQRGEVGGTQEAWCCTAPMARPTRLPRTPFRDSTCMHPWPAVRGPGTDQERGPILLLI